MIYYYIWYLMAATHIEPICTIWVNQLSGAAIIQACGERGDIGSPLNLWYYYSVDAVRISDDQVICTWRAADMPSLGCDLSPLNNYKLVVYYVERKEVLCIVTVTHSGQPTQEDINDNCQDRKAIIQEHQIAGLEYYGLNVEQRNPNNIVTPPPVAEEDIATNINYQALSYHLRFYFGTDYDISEWQNQLDEQINTAGVAYHVPPHILKGVIGIESQYWPLWNGTETETGMIQLTQAGADTSLSWSESLFDEYCPLAIYPSNCIDGYYMLDQDSKDKIINALLRSLYLDGSPRFAMAEAEKDVNLYARILAAFWSYSNSQGFPDWQHALAIYHAGIGCIQDNSICSNGKEYAERINP